MIEIKELMYTYNSSGQALQGVNLNIRAGEFLAILGANGSGKSTLARHLNALLQPTSGSVIVDGLDTSVEENVMSIRHKVGYLFQNPENQLIAPTVGEDVAFGLENLCYPTEVIKERVIEALCSVGMYEYMDEPLQFLSGGQKQCVALAGLIAMQPDYLVLDEPTAMLDPTVRLKVIKVVQALREMGKAIVYITHNLEEIMISDRVIVLQKGQVVLEGEPEEIIKFVGNRGLGIEMPNFLKLLAGLRSSGLEIPQQIKSVEQLVDLLCK